LALKFWYEVGEKPIGNWRPKISFGYSWDKKDCEHNPEFKPIYLVAIGLHPSSNKEKAMESFISEFRLSDPYMVFLNLNSTGEDWCLYASQIRGDKATLRRYHDGEEVARGEDIFSSMLVLDPEKINPLDKYSKEFEFYAPWKPGNTPDYSEIVEPIKIIGANIAKSLQNGLDSGSSYVIKDELVYKNNEFVSKEEAKKQEDFQGRVRKIVLDDEEPEEA